MATAVAEISMKKFKRYILMNFIYSVSQKKPPIPRTCGNFYKTVGNFSTKFYTPIRRSYLR